LLEGSSLRLLLVCDGSLLLGNKLLLLLLGSKCCLLLNCSLMGKGSLLLFLLVSK